MADFILGRLKFHFKGAWTTATAYIKDDVITYGGNSFVCLVNHTAASDFLYRFKPRYGQMGTNGWWS